MDWEVDWTVCLGADVGAGVFFYEGKGKGRGKKGVVDHGGKCVGITFANGTAYLSEKEERERDSSVWVGVGISISVIALWICFHSCGICYSSPVRLLPGATNVGTTLHPCSYSIDTSQTHWPWRAAPSFPSLPLPTELIHISPSPIPMSAAHTP